MSAVFRLEQPEARAALAGAACAFGVFDGVHAGHRFLIDSTCADAGQNGLRSIVLTFDIDPDERFHPERLKKLLSNGERISMLAESGVDAVVVLPFTSELASSSPLGFLQSVFEGNAPASLHVGSDIRFGSKAAGDVGLLRDWGQQNGMRVCDYDLLQLDGEPVTSTRIRHLLMQGDVVGAQKLLSHPYTLRDRVVAGRGEGRDMGFRTANLIVEPMRRILREGVYAAYAIVDGVRYKAAVSVGVSPTFKDQTEAYSEVHILDFKEDIYGQEIEVEFAAWLRPMAVFDSIDELIETVMGDIAWVRDNL